MINDDFIKDIISKTIDGKNEALHAYDKMMWMVRSGYLTLVFAGWSFIIKAAIENKYQIEFQKTGPYILILSAFTLALAFSGYLIDKEYAKRKFRLIISINQLMRQIVLWNYDESENINKNEMMELLQISGDADNLNYKSVQYHNEMKIIKTIYLTPALIVLAIIIYYAGNIFLL